MNLLWNYEFERSFPLTVLHYTSACAPAALHMHDYLEVVLCTQGQGVFVCDGKTISVQQGDVLFISCFFKHVLHATGTQPMQLTLLLFLPVLMDSVWLQNKDKALFEQFWSVMGQEQILVQRHSTAHTDLQEKIKAIDTAFSEKLPAYQCYIDGVLKLLLTEALRYFLSLELSAPLVDFALREKMQPALHYIDTHYAQALSIDTVRAQVHLSASQFCHNFKLATHESFKSYLGTVRIIKAIHLLVSTSLSVTDIAVQTGFSNINHLYALFKKHTGLTPAQYRQRSRGISAPL